jgi:lycopene beta-cyclase
VLLRDDRTRAGESRGLSPALDADILVLGAGVSGLSLAYHLVDRGLGGRRLLLVDPRRSYDNDRTFCFWNVAEHPFETLASHRWPLWRVRGTGSWVVRSAPGLSYQHLPADAFYRRVLERLRATPGVEVRLGVRAGEATEERDCARVECDAEPLRAGVVFDSRPAPRRSPSPGEVTLLQHFEGWHIRAEDGSALFEPSVATLMDFAVPQEHGIHFVYVLPYAKNEALVEATWFGPRVVSDETYKRYLERYIRGELGIGRWSVVRRERGVIPMSTEPMPVRVGERTYRIGLAGGMAKPSTGYAFQAIQRFSAEMAERLSESERPEPPPPRDVRALAMDRVFLSYLARHPDRAAASFETLFERLDPALLVRFLSDRASVTDAFTLMRTMPMGPLTLETFRSVRLWARR